MQLSHSGPSCPSRHSEWAPPRQAPFVSHLVRVRVRVRVRFRVRVRVRVRARVRVRVRHRVKVRVRVSSREAR